MRKLATFRSSKGEETLVIGVLLGTVLSIIVFMVILLAENDITLPSDPIFNLDFSLFRGIGYIILYMWVLGVDQFMY